MSVIDVAMYVVDVNMLSLCVAAKVVAVAAVKVSTHNTIPKP